MVHKNFHISIIFMDYENKFQNKKQNKNSFTELSTLI